MEYINDAKFRETRRVVSMWRCALDQVQDIKIEHDSSMEKLLESLSDMEQYCRERGLDIELCHLANHANYFDEKRAAFYRKRILDWGNNLKREIENEG